MKMTFLFFVLTFVLPVAYQSDFDARPVKYGSESSESEEIAPPRLVDLCEILQIVECEVALVFDHRICQHSSSVSAGLVVQIFTVDTTLMVPTEMYCDPDQALNPMIFYFDHGCEPWTWTVAFTEDRSGLSKGEVTPN